MVTPTDEEKMVVNQKISQELELGIVKKETLSAFLKIVQRIKSHLLGKSFNIDYNKIEDAVFKLRQKLH